MTATMTAPPLEQVAPNLTVRVKEGDLARAQFGLMIAGGLALLVSVVLALTGDSKQFFFSYLVAYMATLGICLGALFFTLIQHITRAGWSITVRRVAENVMACLPWMLLLFLPIVIGFDQLYDPWVNADLEADHVIAGKVGYLNSTFFFVRVALYFLVWIGLAHWFRRSSLRQDETGDPTATLRMSRMAAPALLLFALSITFAAFDWIMSLDPHWFSTIFGVTYFAGAFMAFLAYVTLLCKWLTRKGYLRQAIGTEHYHDLGKLMFTFMIFWTYVNFSQYMLIWYANLPEETAWYSHRQHGGWSAVGTMLIFGHFLVPFAFLMSRHIKRRTLTLCIGAGFLLVMHWIDMQYLILPNMAQGEAAHAVAEHADRSLFGPFGHNLATWASHLTVQDFTTVIGLLLLVTGLVVMNIRKTNLIPTRDPRLSESLAFENQ